MDVRIGLNISRGANILADAFRDCEGYRNLGDPYGAPLPDSSIGPDGWPTRDCDVVLFNGAKAGQVGGTYKCKLGARVDGVFQLTQSPGCTIANRTFSEADWATYFDLVVDGPTFAARNGDHGFCAFEFEHTVRSPSAGQNTGFRSFQVMRPITYGSTASHDFGEQFGREALARYRGVRGGFLRDLDVAGTNDNGGPNYPFQVQTAANRTKATDPIQHGGGRTAATGGNRSLGYALETIIALCNATGCGLWHQLPDACDETLIDETFRLCSTTLQYPLAFTNSNEFFNNGHNPQSGRYGPAADVPAVNAQLNYDANPNVFEVRWRWVAWWFVARLLPSAIAHYGKAAIHDRVFPCLDGQYGDLDYGGQNLAMAAHQVQVQYGAGAKLADYVSLYGGGWYGQLAQLADAPGATVASMLASGLAPDQSLIDDAAMGAGYGLGAGHYEGTLYSSVADDGISDLSTAVQLDPGFGPFQAARIEQVVAAARAAGLPRCFLNVYDDCIAPWGQFADSSRPDTPKWAAVLAKAAQYNPTLVPYVASPPPIICGNGPGIGAGWLRRRLYRGGAILAP